MPGDARPPFPAAHPGNPTGGRPKKTDEMRRAEELMRARSEQGAKDLIELSETSVDDAVRAKLLVYRCDRVFGKPMQAIEMSGPDGDPLLPQFDLSALSDADAGALLKLLRAARREP